MIDATDEAAILEVVRAVLQRNPNGRDRYLMRKAIQRLREAELEEMARHYAGELAGPQS